MMVAAPSVPVIGPASVPQRAAVAQPPQGTTLTDGAADPPGSSAMLRSLGIPLALLGALGFAATAAWPILAASSGAHASAPGDIPAASLVLLLLGFAACFPSLLTDGSGEGYSTMRVAVLAIVCVFCLVTVKAGWSAQGAGELTVTDSWWHVLTVALGGKVAQAFAEKWNGGGHG
jgi:hypothetical protein